MENQDNKNISRKAPFAGMHPALFVALVLIAVFITYQVFGGALTLIIVGGKLERLNENVGTTRAILSFAQFMFILFPAIILFTI